MVLQAQETGVKLLSALCGNEDVQVLLETITRIALSTEASPLWRCLRRPMLELYTGIASLAARQPAQEVCSAPPPPFWCCECQFPFISRSRVNFGESQTW